MVGGQEVGELERRYERPGIEVLDRLRRAKAAHGRLSGAEVTAVAQELDLPRAHVNGAASFFADLAPSPAARRCVRVCRGTACLAAALGRHVSECEHALGVKENTVAADGSTALSGVYCLGYCYGGPAALDGEQPLAGEDLADQVVGRAERRDPPIPIASAVAEPVVLAGLLGQAPDPWSVWPQLVRHPQGAERVRAEWVAPICGGVVARSSPRRPSGRRARAAHPTGRATRSSTATRVTPAPTSTAS